MKLDCVCSLSSEFLMPLTKESQRYRERKCGKDNLNPAKMGIRKAGIKIINGVQYADFYAKGKVFMTTGRFAEINEIGVVLLPEVFKVKKFKGDKMKKKDYTEQILGELKALRMRYPKLRVTQIINNAVGNQDSYYLSDKELFHYLNEYGIESEEK